MKDTDFNKPSVKQLGAALLGILQAHLELLGVELQEEKARLLQLLLLAGISLLLSMLILVGLSAAIVIACWDSYPLLALLLLCALYGAGLLLCLRGIGKLLDAKAPAPFAATLEELGRDKEKLFP